MDVAEIYEAVVDRSHAIDVVLELVATGKLDTVVDLMAAAPALGETPFVTPFLLAVLISGQVISPPDADDTETDPSTLMRLAREQGTDLQRRGAAARLRRLARSAGTDDERGTGFIQLAEILDTEHDATA